MKLGNGMTEPRGPVPRKTGSTIVELRFLTVFVALALLAAQSGCARPGVATLPPPPSEDTRSKFGRIGVTWVSEEAPPTLMLPAAGSCAGSARGAVIGSYFAIALVGQVLSSSHHGGGQGDAYILMLLLALAIAIVPLAVLIGSVYGASVAHPAEEVEAAVDSISRAASDPELPRGIARRILERGRERSDEDLTWLEPGAPRERCDSVLEVGPISVALWGPYQINPSLHLVAAFPVRIVRVSDGSLLYTGTLGWQAPGERELFQWAEEDGARIRRLLEGAGTTFSERVVDQAFLLHLLPADREWKATGRP